MYIKSIWSGKYAHTFHGITNNIVIAAWWLLKWSLLEAIRVLKLNKYHYGNIFGIGNKKTDTLGRFV